MKKICSYSFLAFSVLTLPAWSAAPPSPVATYTGFNGFNIGVGAAYYQTDMDISIDQEGLLAPDVNFKGGIDFSDSSPYFHGQIGYEHAFSRFLLGFSAFADVGQVQDSGVIKTTLPTPALQANVTSEVNNVYGVDFKPGILLSPQVAVYALAGLVFGDIQSTATYVIPNTNTAVGNATNFSDGSTLGYNVGLGAEYLVIPHLSVNAEWSYMKFDSLHQDALIFNLLGPLTVDDTIDVTSNRFLLGVNYLF